MVQDLGMLFHNFLAWSWYIRGTSKILCVNSKSVNLLITPWPMFQISNLIIMEQKRRIFFFQTISSKMEEHDLCSSHVEEPEENRWTYTYEITMNTGTMRSFFLKCVVAVLAELDNRTESWCKLCLSAFAPASLYNSKVTPDPLNKFLATLFLQPLLSLCCRISNGHPVSMPSNASLITSIIIFLFFFNSLVFTFTVQLQNLQETRITKHDFSREKLCCNQKKHQQIHCSL